MAQAQKKNDNETICARRDKVHDLLEFHIKNHIQYKMFKIFWNCCENASNIR